MAFRPSDHIRRAVRDRCRAELLSNRVHPASQRKFWAPADLTGENREGYLQVHGHFHHGICGLHDWDVQSLFLLPRCEVQPRIYNVSTPALSSEGLNFLSCIKSFFATYMLCSHKHVP